MTQQKTDTRSVEASVEIAAPVDAVWKALTDAQELARWFPLDARVTPGAGGSIWMSWEDLFEWEFRIEIWEPGRRLRTSYTQASAGEAPHVTGEKADPREAEAGQPSRPHELAVDYFLEARGGSTVLRLVHSGFGTDASWDEEYDGVNRGWRYELASLRHYLERHGGRDRKVAWSKVPLAVSTKEAWSRLMGPDGMLRDGNLEDVVEGGRYSIRTAAGDAFEGVVSSLQPPRDFSGTAENLNDSLLRVQIESVHDRPIAMLWLATYGLPQAEVERLRSHWAEMLQQLFPEASAH